MNTLRTMPGIHTTRALAERRAKILTQMEGNRQVTYSPEYFGPNDYRVTRKDAGPIKKTR